MEVADPRKLRMLFLPTVCLLVISNGAFSQQPPESLCDQLNDIRETIDPGVGSTLVSWPRVPEGPDVEYHVFHTSSPDSIFGVGTTAVTYAFVFKDEFFPDGTPPTVFCSFTVTVVEEEETETCPDGSAPADCDAVDACTSATCPANPNAQCRLNPCRGCSVEFIDASGNPVQCTQEPETCPDGSSPANCDTVDSCATATCPANLNAQCRVNPCRQCSVEFLDAAGNPVQCRFTQDTCNDGSTPVECDSNPCDDARCPGNPRAECRPYYCGGCFGLFYEPGQDFLVSCRGPPAREECEYNGRTYRVRESRRHEDGCNTCNCEADGTWACTEIACAPGCEYGDRNYEVRESRPHEDGCNTCYCNGDGTWSCTEIACDPGCEYGDRTYRVRDTRPHEDGCNTCNCEADGTWACTEGPCTSGCEYGDRMFHVWETRPHEDGCNTCNCNPDGTWTCTERACELTECQEQAQEALLSQVYIPQCTDSGDYEPIQCDGNINQCWCVDGNGEVIQGTRRGPGQEVVCGEHVLTDCQRANKEAASLPVLDHHIPQCTDSGEYEPKQCYGFLGQCWCVDENGVEIPGSMLRRGPEQDEMECQGREQPGCYDENGVHINEGEEMRTSDPCQTCHCRNGERLCSSVSCPAPPPNCRAYTPPGECCARFECPELTACQRRAQEAGTPPLVGAYIPRCTDSGEYERRQCHGSIGHCWCVDENGVEMDGTRKGPGQGEVECDDDHVPDTCPDGARPFRCPFNPCEVHRCHSHRNAICKPNYCGGCFAEFFDSEENLLDCRTGPEPCIVPADCRVNPCTVETECPAYPNATCTPNFCGGCTTEFFDESNNRVDCRQETCPDGSQPYECLENPCDEQECESRPDAVCRPDYCGGCFAKFYDHRRQEVECSEPATCPDGSDPVECFVDPCTYSTCSAYPDAECRADYCGRCNAKFYDRRSNRELNCDTPAPKPGTCPSTDGLFGTCVELCSSDSDCYGDEKCCSNGCGHVCTSPTSVPPKPGTCPSTDGLIGTCVELCSSDYDCVGDEKCCSNGCGHVCTIPTPVPPACPDGSLPFNCFANPCDTSSCPGNPNARCVPNYCGGCNAEFYDTTGGIVDCSGGGMMTCATGPCQNGGTCQDTTQGAFCTCPPGFSGNRCERPDVLGDPCNPSPCQNGGSCVPLPNDGFVCRCLFGFNGPECNRAMNIPAMDGDITPPKIDCPPNIQHVVPDGVTYERIYLPPVPATDETGRVTRQYTSVYPDQEFEYVRSGGEGRRHSYVYADDSGNSATCEFLLSAIPMGSEDRTPPTLDRQCPANITVTPEEGRPWVIVDWEAPTATDDSPSGNDVLVIRSTHVPGSKFPVSRPFTMVKYRFLDAANNEVNCSFSVSIVGDDQRICDNSPCLNSGQCTDLHNGAYNCRCQQGYGGHNCEIGPSGSACDNNPCLNGATCRPTGTTVGTTSYVCVCAQGYAGRNCEIVTGISACATVRCANGATCIERNGQPFCQCPAGYSGDLCEIGVPSCASALCEAGRCLDTPNLGPICVCPTGYTGPGCTSVISGSNSCAVVDCAPYSECVETTGGPRCICQTGYDGTNCDRPVGDACATLGCANGATCQVTNGRAVCMCPTGYTGPICARPIFDACDTIPCLNGGTCSPSGTSYMCSCAPSYTGRNCETAIGACATVRCGYGATCEETTTGPVCVCPTGLTGDRCDTPVNDPCAICANGATCQVTNGRAVCMCATGYTGPICDRPVFDVCLSSPCQNGGECRLTGTSYTCSCARGYTGRNCETGGMMTCATFPCLNGGTCQDTSDGLGAFCTCPPGFSGDRCERPAPGNVCDNSPCQNGGICKPFGRSWRYQCECQANSYGFDCENSGTPTGPDVTPPRVECPEDILDHVGPDLTYTLVRWDPANATDNYPADLRMTVKPNFQLTQLFLQVGVNPIRIEYTFTDGGGNEATCSFSIGATNSAPDNCADRPCLNGATCRSTANGYFCMCAAGFTGTDCDQVIQQPCNPSPCQNGGICQLRGNDYFCSCASGYTGTDCEDPSSSGCDVNPCQNGATCRPTGTTNFCVCARGYTGRYCETGTDFCASRPCQNGGTCQSSGNSYECTCAAGYYGPNCGHADLCANRPCQNGGTCRSLGNAYICTCATGYNGQNCEQGTAPDSCASQPCQNGGACQLTGNGYICRCASGFTGTNCNQAAPGNVCDNSPCQNGGICKPFGRSGRYQCDCQANFYGFDCENSGPPVGPDVTPPRVECPEDIMKLVPPGQTYTEIIWDLPNATDDRHGQLQLTPRPNFQLPQLFVQVGVNPIRIEYTSIDDAGNEAMCSFSIGATDRASPDNCASRPCLNGATCESRPNGYSCMCGTFFTGPNCEQATPGGPCNPSPCLNGGTCQLRGDTFLLRVCSCPAGYTGTNCEDRAAPDDCASRPCLNGATCQSIPNGYSCMCGTGFTGRNCEQGGPCNPSPCLNGGTCQLRGDTFLLRVCSCPAGYTGTNCEVPDTVVQPCNPSLCQNGATCQLRGSGYVCSCLSGYTGTNCEVQPCNPSPCQNGGNCQLRGNDYFCSCASGYTGTNCEVTDVQPCNPSPCQNGGNCQLRGNGYVCNCASGYTGVNCDQDVGGVDPRICGCPSDVVETITAGTYARISWTVPDMCDDNGGLQWQHQPPNPPRYLTAGQQEEVIYTFTDTANGRSPVYCRFKISARGPPDNIDNEPPVVTQCPQDITVTIGATAQSGEATWTPPVATDDSGDVTLSSNRLPDGVFALGNTMVMYTAVDSAGNMDHSCRFTVKVTRTTSAGRKRRDAEGTHPCEFDPCGPDRICLETGDDTYECYTAAEDIKDILLQRTDNDRFDADESERETTIAIVEGLSIATISTLMALIIVIIALAAIIYIATRRLKGANKSVEKQALAYQEVRNV